MSSSEDARDRSDDVGSAPERPQERRPRLWLGVVAGVATAALVLAAALFAYSRLDPGGPLGPFPQRTVTPTMLGKPWLTVTPNGVGLLHGWATGEADDAPGGPEGAQGYLGIGVVNSVGGVPVTSSIRIFITARTTVTIDGKPFGTGGRTSLVDAFANYNGPRFTPLSPGILTIRFHRLASGAIVADQIRDNTVGAGVDPWQ